VIPSGEDTLVPSGGTRHGKANERDFLSPGTYPPSPFSKPCSLMSNAVLSQRTLHIGRLLYVVGEQDLEFFDPHHVGVTANTDWMTCGHHHQIILCCIPQLQNQLCRAFDHIVRVGGLGHQMRQASPKQR
jgi:hypothetical protein